MRFPTARRREAPRSGRRSRPRRLIEAGGLHTYSQALVDRVRRVDDEHHAGRRIHIGVYVVACGALSIAFLGALAALTHSVLVFPTLGAVAYIMFAHPLSRAARPREVVLGTWLGIALGYVSALAFGVDQAGIRALAADWAHVGSASLALALTMAAMIVTRVEHPPGCSTALLVALGVWDGWQLAALAGAAVLLVALGFGLNRLAGLPYPLWRHHPEAGR